MGTPAYLSPEQAAGHAAGPRSDLYSLGCVLVEMLTGAPPFSADSPLGVLYQHVNDLPAPPSATRPQVPPTLDDVALRLLAKDPADRPASAARARHELLAAVRPADSATRVLPAIPESVVPTRRRPWARRRAVVAGILLAAVALGALLGLQRHSAAQAAVGPATGAPTRVATPTPSGPPSPPAQTPTTSPAPSAPTALLVPAATTAAGAVDAARAVVRAGAAAGLISSSAASRLFDSLDAVQSALHKGHGKSVDARIQDLTDLVRTLTDSGTITGAAVTALHQALTQLSQLAAPHD
jgi:serine/threonine-protein kinase